MDKVVLEGVEYVKASALAKQFRYTSDYLGQLCRAKKIDARLVGRTWFVNPDSVIEHRRKKKYKKAPTKVQQTSDLSIETKSKRKLVLPVVQNRTVKATNDLAVKIAGVKTRKLTVAYEKDEENLIPKLTKKKFAPPKTIRIEQVNAKKIKISGARKETTSFMADELPEVSLSGKLKITPIPESEPIEEKSKNPPENTKSSFENRLISVKQDSAEKTQLSVKKSPEEVKNNKKHKASVKTSNQEPKLTVVNQEEILPHTKKVLSKNVRSPLEKTNLSPVQLEAKTSTVLLVSPLIATVLALVCVLLIFSASSKVVVFGSVYESQIILQLANLLEIIKQ